MGVDPRRCVVLNPGLEIPPEWPGTRDEAATRIRRRFGLPADAQLLVTLGRLVRRKGARWFVSEVMPSLSPNAFLLIAGTGPEETATRDATRKAGLESRVRLLGAVDDEMRALLFAGCDLFVMPNLPVPNDTEGFGLVAIEASNSGALVVASRLEGIIDAVTDGATGYLVEPLAADAWVARVASLLGDPVGARADAAKFAIESRLRSSFERMAGELPAALGIVSGAATKEQQSP
jgi:glycosyltransferase involved in cell wall biosynthesis